MPAEDEQDPLGEQRPTLGRRAGCGRPRRTARRPARSWSTTVSGAVAGSGLDAQAARRAESGRVRLGRGRHGSLGGAGGLSSPDGQAVETGASTLSASRVEACRTGRRASRCDEQGGRGDGAAGRRGGCPPRSEPGFVEGSSGSSAWRSPGRRGRRRRREGARRRSTSPPRSLESKGGLARALTLPWPSVSPVMWFSVRKAIGLGSGPTLGRRSGGMLSMRSPSCVCSLPV